MIIVGGGPVGLFMALCLARLGIDCQVLEQKTEIDLHSKSLGIHPVSLELFDRLNITTRFLQEGVQIRNGHAFLDHKPIGTLSLDRCPPPHPYVLSLPQNRTELILEDLLEEVSPGTLLRGAQVTSIKSGQNPVEIEYSRDGSLHQITSHYVIGCDGKNSMARESAGIPFKGKSYPDTYIMGDFSDNTDLGESAAIFLHREGLTESFPIPGGYRRWVLSTDGIIPSPGRDLIETLTARRSGYSLKGTDSRMLSGFGVHFFQAETLYKDRTFLAGDAAHIVSPIGGQGMNVGWLGAWDLAQTLDRVLKQPGGPENLLRDWSVRHKKRAATSARRAEWNMKMGRKRRFPVIRNGIARLILKPPFNKRIANIFTMRGLE